MRFPILVLGASAALVLAGCSGGAPTPTPSGGSTAPGDGLASCLDGAWSLDIDHLAEQLDAAVDVPGVPVDEFAVDGTGSVSFTEGGDVSGAIDVRATGSLDDGTPFDVPADAEFEGTWAPGDEPGTIAIEDWSYETGGEPGAEGVELPRPMDFSDLPTIEADCSEDALVLTAGMVPLEVRWIRDEP